MNPKAAFILDLLVPFGPYMRRAEGLPAFDNWPALFWRVLSPMFLIYWLASQIPYVGTIAYMLILVPLSAAMHARSNGRPYGEVLLHYLVVILIGFGGVWSFVGHTFLADQVAASIGWATGSPFQTELAFFTLGSAIAGLLGIWLGGHLITALVISKSVFLYGAAGVHIHDALLGDNFSYLNIGPPLIGDLLFPTLMLTLLWRHFPKNGLP